MPENRPNAVFTYVVLPVLLVACLVAGGFVGAVLERRALAPLRAKQDGAGAVTTDDRSTNVAVTVLKPGPIAEVIPLPCSVEAFQEITLASEISGSISAVLAEEGDAVKKGQVIATCDMRTLQARCDDAAAELRLAKATLKRLKVLNEQGFAPDEDMDRAETELATKETTLRLAQIELDKAVLRSPIDGILDRRPVDVGEYVNPGQPVAHIVDISKVNAVVALPEIHVPFVKPGAQMLVQFPYLDGAVAPMAGAVCYLATIANEKSRTYRVEIELENPGGQIRPGMIGKVYLRRRFVPDALAVPFFAVIVKESRRLCAVEENGTARLREVTLGFHDDQRFQVTSGLLAGDRLIISGHRELADGDPVKVVQVVPPSQGTGKLAARRTAEAPDGALHTATSP